MKKFAKSVSGVTLLEIMLVLAIAAMIIVMSVRYYQSATSNQQANQALQIIQGITAAADGLAQGSGSYATANVSTNTIMPLMPSQNMTAPWGGQITVSNAAASSYQVSLDATPPQVCLLLTSRMASNSKYNITSSCGATAAAFVYTYDTTL